MKKNIELLLQEIGVVPVAALDHAEDAVPLAGALCAGGLPCVEITFRTEAAMESIRQIAENCPEILVGAGTVLTARQVDQAAEAGAGFIVSPGFDAEIVDYCIQKELPVFPGCVTPSEVMQALKRGLKVVKFFPAEAFGGLETIKALAAPYAGLKFMPTGGIHADNLGGYLANKAVLACGGSWMVKRELIKAGKFQEITRLAAEAALLVKEIREGKAGAE